MGSMRMRMSTNIYKYKYIVKSNKTFFIAIILFNTKCILLCSQNETAAACGMRLKVE